MTPRRPCLTCGRPTPRTYCPEHQPRQTQDRHRLTHAERGYDAEYRRNRPLVLERDGWTCVYCGAPADTVDHVVPWTRSRDNGMGNLVAACRRCNSSKGDRVGG